MFRSSSRIRVYAPETGEIVTKQSHRAECDINNILSQYKKTGVISHIMSRQGEYLDLPSSPDYQSALNLVLEAQEAFAHLPAVVRDRFNNDPKRLLAALGDPAFTAELQDLGILSRPAPAASAAAPANAAPAAPAAAPAGSGAAAP